MSPGLCKQAQDAQDAVSRFLKFSVSVALTRHLRFLRFLMFSVYYAIYKMNRGLRYLRFSVSIALTVFSFNRTDKAFEFFLSNGDSGYYNTIRRGPQAGGHQGPAIIPPKARVAFSHMSLVWRFSFFFFFCCFYFSPYQSIWWCFVFLSEPVAFRRVYGLESCSRTSGESNHHRQCVNATRVTSHQLSHEANSNPFDDAQVIISSTVLASSCRSLCVLVCLGFCFVFVFHSASWWPHWTV